MSVEQAFALRHGRGLWRGLHTNRALPTGAPDRELGIIAAAALAAAVAGYGLASGHMLLALVVSLFPLVAWLLPRPTVPLVLLGASIPAFQNLTGGGGGYNVAASDLLLVLVGAGILLQAAIAGSFPALRALRPVALPVALYGVFMMLLLAYHLGVSEVAQTGQRFELLLLPLVVGAFAALNGRHILLLQAYVVSTSVLAVVWPLDSFGLQKNPVGQFIGNAILLLVGVPSLRRFLPCLVVLVPGLLLTQSRGAIVATALGTVVILAMQGFKARTVLSRAVPIVLIAVVAFALMPTGARERITTFSAESDTPAAYAIRARQEYARDAWQIIHAHPWTGVGIGNYLASSTDPHQVLLLQAAEGGYILAGLFVFLVLGTLLALRMMRNVEIVPAATGVLLATAAHGLVDVYWVRGTPLLGWLLVGMACGALARGRKVKATA